MMFTFPNPMTEQNANTTEARLTAAWNEVSQRVERVTAQLAAATTHHQRAALLHRLHHLDRLEDEAARRLFRHLMAN